MIIKTTVDLGSKELEINIDMNDVLFAISEAIAYVTEDLNDEKPNVRDILRTLNTIGAFINAFSGEQIAALNEKQRQVTSKFFYEAAARFAPAPK